MLIIRPCYEKVTRCTAEWGQELINKLKIIGKNYKDCKGEEATVFHINNHIESNSIKSIVFYGHGERPHGQKWFGQNKEIILHIDDLSMLKSRFIYDVSCFSANSIGKKSILEGAICY